MQSPFAYLFRFFEIDTPADMPMIRRMALRLTPRIASVNASAAMHEELLSALEHLADARETMRESMRDAQRKALDCMYRTLVIANQHESPTAGRS